jgi:hypothetical protein
MKKIILSFVFIFLITLFKPNLNANSNYLPEGKNYLDPENFELEFDGDYCYFRCLNPFRIKENTVYTLRSTIWQYYYFDETYFIFYDDNFNEINVDIVFEEEWDQDYGVFSLTFSSPAGARYIELDFDIVTIDRFYEDFGIETYMFFEGDEFEGYEPYLGPKEDWTVVYPNIIGRIFTNVDNPISLTEIKEALIAEDAIDGVLTSSITVSNDQYTPNINTLGCYEISFQAIDTAGNNGEFLIYVHILDQTPPVISGHTLFITSPKEHLDIENIISELAITDNYDRNLNLVLEADAYSPNKDKIGDYIIRFSATDNSGNTSHCDVKIEVRDQEGPEIFGITEFEKSYSKVIPIADIIANLQAYDEVDGDVTDSIKVRYDQYSANSHKIGRWRIDVEACDESKNYSNYTFYVKVIDDVPPLFYFNNQIITITLEENPLTLQMVINSLKKESINEEAKIEVIVDEYSENEKTPGTYKVVLEAGDEVMDLEIRVSGEVEVVEELTFWEKIGLFFKNIWKWIINLFS